jgi:hypothetical protein
LYLLKKCVGFYRIEALIGPHYRNKLTAACVYNGVGITRRYINHLQSAAPYFILNNLIGIYFPEPDNTFSTYYQKFFILCLMPVIALGNSGFDTLPKPDPFHRFL